MALYQTEKGRSESLPAACVVLHEKGTRHFSACSMNWQNKLSPSIMSLFGRALDLELGTIMYNFSDI